MFQRGKSFRNRVPLAALCRVRPALELLESRAAPSALQFNRLLSVPLAGPLAQAGAPVAGSERDDPMTPPASLREEQVPKEASKDVWDDHGSLAERLSPLFAVAVIGREFNTTPVAPPAPATHAPGRPALETGVKQLGDRVNKPFDEGNDTPEITSFSACEDDPADGWWTFKGTVQADVFRDMAVHFGGLPSLEGTSVGVEQDGTFTFHIELQPCEQGLVTAEAVNWEGIHSNVADDYVHQTTCYPSGPHR